ncbi:venom carboxylesterase-6 [Diaphorina citri]|uniref:Venom carboxylesterase-6 n=1 Tax=Diaphorina citri TaxID=121845 RepID=A0A3Q0JBD4_DIACI|nr:venom carboxylesterase-6 [Diaphorina citri]
MAYRALICRTLDYKTVTLYHGVNLENHLHLAYHELKKHQVKNVVRVCEPTYKVEDLKTEGINVKDLAYEDGTSPSPEYYIRRGLYQGLFHRAISMSGTSLCPWTLAENLPEKTKIIANQLGCPVECNEKMVECLRSRPAALIADAVRLIQPFYYNPFSPWGPTVDSFAKNPILPDFPAELIKQGKIADVPWLNSVTTDEGLYPAAEFLASEEALETIDADWTSLAPHILDFNFTVPDNLKAKIAEKIRQKYLGDKPINLENKKAFVQIMSDRMFIADAERTSRLQSKVCKSPVYFYYFNFRGRYSLSNHYANRLDDYGVSHADDTQYILTVLGDAVMRDTNGWKYPCQSC